MDRPHLVNFSAIASENLLTIKASITPYNPLTNIKGQASPIKSISLFSKHYYRLKIVGLNDAYKKIFNRVYDSDNYGNFEIKIPMLGLNEDIRKISVYETSTMPGIELHLGSFLPLFIKEPKKIIISDFDKTLVDTKYSTPKEMYYSLNKPLNYFPTVDSSVYKLKEFINEGYQAFILSASPHFYENAIRDWLYQNEIYASDIFLKDYRDFFSIFDGALTTKDLKKHGFYKLNQLINILLMTRVPRHLVLLGDGFESDPFIYLTLKKLLDRDTDPWKLWKSIKNHKFFNLTSKQDSYFITKFYQVHEMAKSIPGIDVQIYIRGTEANIENLKSQEYKNKSIDQLRSSINYYI